MKIATFKISFFFLLLLCSLLAYTQENTIDSLKKILQTQKEDSDKVNTLNELARITTANNDTNVRLQIANDALILAEKLEYKQGTANAHAIKGNIYGGSGNYGMAAAEHLIALQIRNQLNDKAAIANSYLSLAYSYTYQNNFPATFKYLFLSLKVSEEIKDTINITKLFIEIGKTYEYQEDSSTARKYFKLAVEIANKVQEKDKLISIFSYLATASLQIQQYEKAFEFATASLKTYPEKGYFKNGFEYVIIGHVYRAKADSASAVGNYPLRKKYYLNAISNYQYFERYSKLAEDKGNLSAIYIDIANAFFNIGYLDSARIYFNKSNSNLLGLGFLDNQKSVYKGLYRLDSIDKNYPAMFENYKQYILYSDSLTDKKNIAKVEIVRLQYEFDKKEAAAKAEQDKKDLDTKRIKNLQYFMIGALAIVVLAVVLIAVIQYRNNKHKQKANRLLQQQKEMVEDALHELKLTQSQLIQFEKMASLGELTAGIAHEIQNPLNFVNNFSEVNKELIDELKSEKLKITSERDEQLEAELLNDIAENSEKINHHGKRADAIVKGMLQHSQKSTGQKEPTDINKLADEYLRLAYQGIRAKDKSFNATPQTNFDENIGTVNIIPQDIGRAILNLVNNAFYAVDEKKKRNQNGYEPTVSVSTKKTNGKVEISVSDNGSGIPQNIVDKIFQPFFTTKPTGQGTGLGLSLAYDIVKAHGGEIKVETNEGEGSEFIIKIPITA